jgi:hypothetical protein
MDSDYPFGIFKLFLAKGEGWDPINSLAKPHVSVYTEPRQGFPSLNVMILFVFSDLRY